MRVWNDLKMHFRKLGLCRRCLKNRCFIHGICLDCYQALPLISGDVLTQPFSHHLDNLNIKIQAIFNYTGAVKEMICQLKYQQALWTVPILGAVFIDRVAPIETDTAVIIPMPMHHRRRRKRGYNQVAVLAAWVANRLHMTVNMNLLTRNRDTEFQHGLNKQERIKNVKGCFTVKQYCHQPVILFDDVMTTGSSLREACRALISAGYVDIHIWVIAVADLSAGSYDAR